MPVELDAGARAVFAVSGRLADVSTLDEKDARLFATLANHAGAAPDGAERRCCRRHPPPGR